MACFSFWRSKYSHMLFLVLLIAGFALRIPVLFGLYLGLAFLVVVLGTASWPSATNTERALIGIYVLFITLVLPVSALRHPTALGQYVIALLAPGAAFLLTRNRAAYLWASLLSLLLVQVSVLSYLCIVGFANFPLENMIPESSSNGITSYLIVLQANYSIFNFIQRRRASLVTVLLTLVICVVGYGRGSILAAVLLLATNLLSLLSWHKLYVGLLRSAVALLLIGAVSFWYSSAIADFVEANTKIGSGLFDETRDRMLGDYFRKMNPLTALVGVDYEGTSIATEFNNNPHNSYVRAHHIFGLPYLLALMLFPLAALRVKRPWQVTCYAGATMLAVLFRAATEPILFPTPFDFYFFAACFALLGTSAKARAPSTSFEEVPT